LVLGKRASMSFDSTPLSPGSYTIVPDCAELADAPYCLCIQQGTRLRHGERVLKAVYLAGYKCGDVPADLASACLELAAWNMGRYRGRRIGVAAALTGSSGRGSGGETFEMSLPEQVRTLLEPFRRCAL
jgi:hypothetical protein